MSNLLQRFPVIVDQHVAWGEMDLHHHVNNVHFFKYIENARIAYYEKIGKYDIERETGIGFVLGRTSCVFKASLEYPDVVSVGARISEVLDDRVVMQYRVISHKKNCIVAEADATLVSFEQHLKKKVSIPDVLKCRIAEFEGVIEK